MQSIPVSKLNLLSGNKLSVSECEGLVFAIINEDNRGSGEKFGGTKDVKIEDLLNISSKDNDTTPFDIEQM